MKKKFGLEKRQKTTAWKFILFIIDLKILAKWAPAVVNHLYWSIFTCNGNGKELVERFTSIIHHSVNRHVFTHNIYYKRCEHPALTADEKREKEWLVMGSAAHEKLVKVVTERSLLVDMEKLTEQINTTLLEVFHSVKIRYLPKSIFFRMEKMIAGMQLAALDHNHNINREQVNLLLLFTTGPTWSPGLTPSILHI